MSDDVLAYMASHPSVAKFAVPDDCVVVEVSTQCSGQVGRRKAEATSPRENSHALSGIHQAGTAADSRNALL